jgi:cation transport ATPase
VAAIGAAVLLVLVRWTWLGDPLRYGAVMALAAVVYLPVAQPLHRRASRAISSRTADLAVFFSIVASVAFWISTAIAVAWLSSPRWFPLRWLDDTLSPPVFFWQSAALVALGLLVLSRSPEARAGD